MAKLIAESPISIHHNMKLADLKRKYKNCITKDYYGIIKLSTGEILEPVIFLAYFTWNKNFWFVAHSKRYKLPREFKGKNYPYTSKKSFIERIWLARVEDMHVPYQLLWSKYRFKGMKQPHAYGINN